MSWSKWYPLDNCIYQVCWETRVEDVAWRGLAQWLSMEQWHGWCHTEVKIYPTKCHMDFWEGITKWEGKPTFFWVFQHTLKHATSKYSGFPVWRKMAWTQVTVPSDSKASTNVCKSCCSLFLWWFVSLHLAGKTWSHSNDLWWLKPAAFPFCLRKFQTCHCLKKLLGSCLDEFEGQLGKLNLSIFWNSTDRQPQTEPWLSVICSALCLGPRDTPDWIFPLNNAGVLSLPLEPPESSSFPLIQTKPLSMVYVVTQMKTTL